MKKLSLIIAVTATVLVLSLPDTADAGFADIVHSRYPTIFAHGMGGFDKILTFHYWGDDVGTFVGDPFVNWELDYRNRSHSTKVTAFMDSYTRGLQLANQIESYIVGFGWKDYKEPYIDDGVLVNIIGHSQGGLDMRKASKELYQRQIVVPYEAEYNCHWFWGCDYETRYRTLPANTKKTGVLVSIASPHRGSIFGNEALDHNAVEGVVGWFLETMYDFLWDCGEGNDGVASMKSVCWNDADPNDGVDTSVETFNINNPANTYASAYRSYIVAQNNPIDVNPVLHILHALVDNPDIDGFNYNKTVGDGDPNIRDDDGLVGVGSAHMGIRMSWDGSWDGIQDLTYLGNLTNLNNPTYDQVHSMDGVKTQDHLDVMSLGPDMFDEMKFYCAIIEHIDSLGF